MILKSSKPLLITLLLISTALLAVLIFGVYSIRAKNNKTFELLNLANQTAEMGILAQSIRAVQKNAREDLESFDSMVLSGDKLVLLIESIEEAGRTIGLDADILSVTEVEDKKNPVPKTVRIAIETQGIWAETLSFLHAIESLPNRVVIDETSFSKEETGWRSRIVLSLYSFN